MIIFAEHRELVVGSYRPRFESAGESLVQLHGRDLRDWLATANHGELSAVEAVLLGEQDDETASVAALRGKIDAPMVAMLDHKNLERLVKLYRAGVDDVVVKPVHFDELLVRIAAIKKRSLRTGPALPSAHSAAQKSDSTKPVIALFFDGTDPHVGSEPLALPRRERRILEYLAGIHGRRATKAQIFNAIYGLFDEHIDENVIESHISKLRKKLRQALGYDPIDSKRYLGYQLAPGSVSIMNENPAIMVA